MRSKETTPFKITGIDSLGQGVSKVTDKITFIPKTAPGDVGEAEVMAARKGVVFGRVLALKESSPMRQVSICEHFSECPSCHFLHLSYEDELKFKKENFLKLFRKLQLPEVEVIGADDRTGYRNRIQIHYSLKSKLIGMKDPQTFEIISIPKCIIGVKPIQEELQRLYDNSAWMKEAPSAPIEGHLELYWKDGVLKKTWNSSYASGGFTQVYEAMNIKLKKRLGEVWNVSGSELLDLFGGNGNLSDSLSYSKRLCVDFYKILPGENFLSQDLYADSAIKNVLKKLSQMELNPKHLLIDPPRSGLKNISDWVKELRPESIAYVSCDPHTLVRDLQGLTGYTIKEAFLADFFPSTFHFESMVILQRDC